MELANLYKGTKLYQIADVKIGDNEPISLPNPYNGIAILYEYNTAKALPEALNEFLTKILELGLKVNPTECLVANLDYTAITIQQLAEMSATKLVVIFGMDWVNSLHNIKAVKNKSLSLYGIKVLPSDTLAVIQSNEEAKKQFWVQLKDM